MNLQVLLFGIISDIIGETDILVSVPLDTSVLEFKQQLQLKFPELRQLNEYSVAINECYCSENVQLKENDIVAIIPPVSGG